MIGTQSVGAIEGVVITAVAAEGLRAAVHGRPARLAIVLDDGTVISAGDDVAREALAVAVNFHRQVMIGQGHLRVISHGIEEVRR